jgi:hypothetical protein
MPFNFDEMKQQERKLQPDERRHALLEQVLCGRISPQDAENKANELGLGGFSGYSDPCSFSIMEEDVWTIDMALAWIVWRTPKKVVEHWSAYRRTCWGWQALYQMSEAPDGRRLPSISGYRLVQLPHQSVFAEHPLQSLLIFDQNDALAVTKKLSRVAAEKALRRALIDSQLVASAVDCESRKTVSIPAREWPRIHYSGTWEGTELLVPDSDFFDPEEVETAYRSVTLLRKDLLRLWPADGADFLGPEIETHSSKLAIERRYRTWLKGLPKTQQIAGLFFLDVWALDIKPIDDESRYRLIEKYAKNVLEGVPPSARSIARFFEDVEPWLESQGL